MIIRIKKVKLYLPTSLLKSRFVYKNIVSNSDTNLSKKDLDNLYKLIKDYKKKYGSFTLVEVLEENKVVFMIKI